MEVLVFSLVVAAFVQRVAADWWAGVTGKQFPSQQYRMKRLEMRAQRYAAAGKPLPARGPARQYASDMWALAWQTASRRHADWWERHEAKRRERKQQKQDQPHPMRDYFRIVWKTGPARRWHDAWQRAIDKRQRKLAAAGEPADQIPETADGNVIPFRKPEPKPHVPEQREADPEQREADPEQREADPEQREADPEQRLRMGWLKVYHRALNEVGSHYHAKDLADFYVERYRDLDPDDWPEKLLSGGRREFDRWLLERHKEQLAERRKEQEKHAARNGRNPSGHEENNESNSEDNGRPNGGDVHNETERKQMSTTTTVNAEVTGLESAIQYAKGMADSCRAGANSVEQAVAGLVAGEVRGDAIAHLTSAQDQLTSAATVFEAAAEALARQRVVKESYEAVPDAGSREFVTSE